MAKSRCPYLHSFGHVAQPPASAAGAIYPVQRARLALHGLPCFWHGLPCCLCCAACPGALGLGSPPAGYIAAAQPRPVSLSTTEKIKKAQKITPPPLSISKISRKNKKDPYKGSAFCAILALQALKGRNLQ